MLGQTGAGRDVIVATTTSASDRGNTIGWPLAVTPVVITSVTTTGATGLISPAWSGVASRRNSAASQICFMKGHFGFDARLSQMTFLASSSAGLYSLTTS